jgi:hypothetical protein
MKALTESIAFPSTVAVQSCGQGRPWCDHRCWQAAVHAFQNRRSSCYRFVADQAAIALENAGSSASCRGERRNCRGLWSIRTATAEVLQVISSSKFQLQPVLDTVVHSAVRLCAAENAFVFLRSGDLFHVAQTTASHAFEQFRITIL